MKIVEAGQSIESPTVNWLIYGNQETGKTSLAGLVEGSIIMDFDAGAKGTPFRQRAIPKLTYEDYIKNKAWVHSQIATSRVIIIDTLGSLLDSIGDYMVKQDPRLKNNGIKLYGEIGNGYKDFHNEMTKLDKDIICIAHERETTVGDFTKYDILAVGNVAKEHVLQKYDYVSRYKMTNGQRVLTFRTDNSDLMRTKNRGNIESEVIVPNFEIEPSFPTEFFEKLRSKLGVVFVRNKDREDWFALKIEQIKQAKTAKELNDIRHDYSNYTGGLFEVTDTDKKLLFDQLKSVANANNLQFDKVKGFFGGVE